MFFILLPATASVYSYFPVSVTVIQSSPPFYFVKPESSATATIGPNKTSANVMAQLSSNPSVISNPDFYMSADPWLCYTYSYGNLRCYWLSSDTGASGGVGQIYGNTKRADYGFLIQSFTVPVNVSSFNISVKWKLVSTLRFSITELEIIVYDATTNSTVVWYNTSISTSNSYTYTNLTVNQALDKTHQYWIEVGVYSYQYLFQIQGTIDFRVDYADIHLSNTPPSFSGELIRINTSQNISIRYVIDSIHYNGSWNGSLTLEGEYETSSINFTNSIPDRYDTDWLEFIVQSNSLYVSGKLRGSFIASASSYLIIEGHLEITVGGVKVYYPLSIDFSS